MKRALLHILFAAMAFRVCMLNDLIKAVPWHSQPNPTTATIIELPKISRKSSNGSHCLIRFGATFTRKEFWPRTFFSRIWQQQKWKVKTCTTPNGERERKKWRRNEQQQKKHTLIGNSFCVCVCTLRIRRCDFFFSYFVRFRLWF